MSEQEILQSIDWFKSPRCLLDCFLGCEESNTRKIERKTSASIVKHFRAGSASSDRLNGEYVTVDSNYSHFDFIKL